jgi:type I restriction enzyme R subunit
MEPGRLFESPYTDHGQVDVVFPNDVTVIMDLLRDVNRTAIASAVA